MFVFKIYVFKSPPPPPRRHTSQPRGGLAVSVFLPKYGLLQKKRWMQSGRNELRPSRIQIISDLGKGQCLFFKIYVFNSFWPK